jgi:UDP-N-acetylmuramoyl-tripeptide--D-alanyl-D-alanine ligase
VSLWTSEEIAAAVGGTANAPFEVGGVAFDSREVGVGDLFIALKGDVTNGHRFLDNAFRQGAGGAIVSVETSHPSVRVADTTDALARLGAASRGRSSATIIGVTGSVGKTGTKEALHAALDRASRGTSHRSVKSYNNHTGVPLSLARMPRDARYGVFEMGMNHAGELAVLTRLVRPHIALVTTIAPAHTEFFASEAGIADAKGEIFEGLEPGGTGLVPFDSPHYARLAEKAGRHAERVLSFGLGEGADVHAVETYRQEDGSTFITARLPDRELSFTLSLPGAHWVANAMGVLAAAWAAGADLAQAGLALGDLGGLPGRGARLAVPAEGGAALVIDESYNANPASMAATLKVLGAERASRRIAVLGEMRELGARSGDYHAGLADPVLEAGVDLALLVGPGMAPLADALEGRVETVHAPDAATVLESLKARLRAGDAVLIKGSNAVGLGGVVKALASGTV